MPSLGGQRLLEHIDKGSEQICIAGELVVVHVIHLHRYSNDLLPRIGLLVRHSDIFQHFHLHLQRSRLRAIFGERHLALKGEGREVLVLQHSLAQKVIRAHNVIVVDFELDRITLAAACQHALEVPDGIQAFLDGLGLELLVRLPHDSADAVGVRRPAGQAEVCRTQALRAGDVDLEPGPALLLDRRRRQRDHRGALLARCMPRRSGLPDVGRPHHLRRPIVHAEAASDLNHLLLRHDAVALAAVQRRLRPRW
mmetsp:Transcript_64776/g.166706  ORF Transcript_64776/g.166706 Transcript_64776/m.166706 type:complete len:253 (+) Transcript_64776:463-1221(+)